VEADAGGRKLERFGNDVLVYVTDLYRAALRLTGRVSDAEDLVQETCLRAFECLEQLKHPPAAKVWVFSILRSVFLRQAERASSRPALVSLEDIDASRLIASETLQDAYENFLPVQQTLVDEVRRAILKLPLAYREAIILAHIAGFSYREMAQILGVPLGTVMSRLFRARRMLRTSLRERRNPSEAPR
jgi:RNA polymerase sigma-70 factor (ECF subfamily)